MYAVWQGASKRIDQIDGNNKKKVQNRDQEGRLHKLMMRLNQIVKVLRMQAGDRFYARSIKIGSGRGSLAFDVRTNAILEASLRYSIRL